MLRKLFVLLMSVNPSSWPIRLTYLSSRISLNVAVNTALLREILEERYVSLIGQLEGFTDMRRTNNFLNIPLAAGKTDFPKRFLYSQIEVNTNPNVPKVNVGLYDPVNSFST